MYGWCAGRPCLQMAASTAPQLQGCSPKATVAVSAEADTLCLRARACCAVRGRSLAATVLGVV